MSAAAFAHENAHNNRIKETDNKGLPAINTFLGILIFPFPIDFCTSIRYDVFVYYLRLVAFTAGFVGKIPAQESRVNGNPGE
ncbi:MAG: hypothetical protein A3I59_08940 [Planctomycetes bacterium RIFCSPLOWO2_02_FULL_50_16]|nr:MAG: hypothetical protein A3I59_08940 [Planctomycetes bacterium RIFCSPLOWO2_02_FULL_50_16]